MEESTDAIILAAWAEYLKQRDALDARLDLEAEEYPTEAEAAYWALCDEAEATILETPATSLLGVAIKLRLALVGMLTKKRDEDAIRRGDLDLVEVADLEWTERLTLAALRSLETMGA